MNRRDFIKIGTIGGFLSTTVSTNLLTGLQDFIAHDDNVLWQKRVLPKSLKDGSKVAITAPASPVSLWELRNTTKDLRRMGLEVEIGDTIKKHDKNYRYLSASDQERAGEFMKYIESPEIDCILAGRGGYGVMRILPLLDYDVIKNNPKIIVGFSDITALLIAISVKTGLVTFHGPVGVVDFNAYTTLYFKKMLYNYEKFEPITISNRRYDVINEGICSGRLTGGNLTLVVATLGSEYEINTEDAILFLEDVTVEPYHIDRMLTQLWLAGKFEKCKGVIFGDFKGLDARKNFYPTRSFTRRQVIYSRMKDVGVPAIIGAEIGHDNNKITMPLGTNAMLNATERSFTILEPSVV